MSSFKLVKRVKYFTCFLILGTYWTTFVFMSMLKRDKCQMFIEQSLFPDKKSNVFDNLTVSVNVSTLFHSVSCQVDVTLF